MLVRLVVAVVCLALASCSSGPAADGSCGSAVIGAAGGAVLAGNGATLVVPPGALSVSTEVSLCALTGFPPRRDQQAELVVVRPTTLALAAPAAFTIPIRSESLSSARIEIGQSLEDDAPVVLTELRASSASVSFEHDHFGYVRVFGMPLAPIDAGSDGAPPDAPRADSGPPPLAPVVVGIDLDPADYGCLGMRVVGTRGEPVPVDLHVIDWHDRSFRASYQLRVLLTPPNPDLGQIDCSATPDCVLATSDATGHAMVTIPSGPTWVDVIQFDPMGTFTDDRHTPARHVHLPIDVPAAGGTVELEALSQRTHTSVGGFTFHFGQLSMGHVRDCDGQPVQRARIRLFDGGTGAELVDTDRRGMLTYGSTSGLPTGGSDRTGADGTFLVDNQFGVQDLRIEAWGQLVAGGPEVMLACELRAVTSSTMVVGDLLPAAATRTASCSE